MCRNLAPKCEMRLLTELVASVVPEDWAYSKGFHQNQGAQVVSSSTRKGSSVAWPCILRTAASSKCCRPGHGAVQVTEWHLLFKHSFILEMFFWCKSNQPFTSLRGRSPALSRLCFCTSTCSPTSLGRGSFLRSVQIGLLWPLLKPSALFLPFITDPVLYDVSTLKHHY